MFEVSSKNETNFIEPRASIKFYKWTKGARQRIQLIESMKSINFGLKTTSCSTAFAVDSNCCSAKCRPISCRPIGNWLEDSLTGNVTAGRPTKYTVIWYSSSNTAPHINNSQSTLAKEEEEEDIYLTQINSNHGNSTPIVTEPGCQKTRRLTMLAIHRIRKLLTYIQKNKKTKTKNTKKHTHTSMHQ